MNRRARPGCARVLAAVLAMALADALDAQLGEPGHRPRAAIVVVAPGTGTPTEFARRAAEPFFTTRAARGGCGLGLSMVEGFCRQSGGELRIDSQAGLGTAVTMSLPEGHPTPNTSDVRAPNKQGPFFGQTALLVEDNERLRRVLELALAEIGFDVRSAPDGDAARVLLDADPCPTLLFSDIRMPGEFNGVQFALWATQRCPGLRVLLQTGFAEEDAGRFPVLRKPFTAEELVEAIARLLAGDPD